MDLRKLQKLILRNKIKKGFNTTDIDFEFCHLYGEVAEAYDAYIKKKDDLGEELADIGIFLLGLAEILDVDLGAEIDKKMVKNARRVYKEINGVLTRIDD